MSCLGTEEGFVRKWGQPLLELLTLPCRPRTTIHTVVLMDLYFIRNIF